MIEDGVSTLYNFKRGHSSSWPLAGEDFEEIQPAQQFTYEWEASWTGPPKADLLALHFQTRVGNAWSHHLSKDWDSHDIEALVCA